MPTIGCSAAPGKGEEGAGFPPGATPALQRRGVQPDPMGNASMLPTGTGAGSTRGSLPAWVGAVCVPRAGAAPRPSLCSHRAAPARVDFAAWASPGLWMPPGVTQGRLPREIHLWFNISHSITSRFSAGARGHFPSLFRHLSRAGKIPSCTWPSGKHPPCSELCFPFPSLKSAGASPEAHLLPAGRSQPCCRSWGKRFWGLPGRALLLCCDSVLPARG